MSRGFRPALVLLLPLAVWWTAGAVQDPAVNDRLRTFDAAWQLVKDTHFDASLNGVDWDRVRNELRPRAAAARTDEELRAIVAEMMARLGQSHFYVLPASAPDAARGPVGTRNEAPVAAPESARGDFGFEVRVMDGRVLVSRLDPSGPAARAGVRSGWIVTSVDGRGLTGTRPGASGPATTEATLRASAALRGAPDTRASLTFADGNDRPVNLTLTRRALSGTAIKFGNLPAYVATLTHARMPSDGRCQTGVIRFNVWMIPIGAQFDAAVDALRDCAGMVVDLRGNPGGMAAMAMGIAGHFLSDARSLGTMKLRDAELRFLANPRTVTAEGRRVTPFRGPLAILVDGMSFSASEMFAGGMQAIDRAWVFGERTAGAVLPALFDRLPNGDVLAHAFADFVTPDGVRLEGRGVIPDVEVVPTRQALLRGRDPALDAALEWMAKQQH